jgi:hypothetical protein
VVLTRGSVLTGDVRQRQHTRRSKPRCGGCYTSLRFARYDEAENHARETLDVRSRADAGLRGRSYAQRGPALPVDERPIYDRTLRQYAQRLVPKRQLG